MKCREYSPDLWLIDTYYWIWKAPSVLCYQYVTVSLALAASVTLTPCMYCDVIVPVTSSNCEFVLKYFLLIPVFPMYTCSQSLQHGNMQKWEQFNWDLCCFTYVQSLRGISSITPFFLSGFSLVQETAWVCWGSEHEVNSQVATDLLYSHIDLMYIGLVKYLPLICHVHLSPGLF